MSRRIHIELNEVAEKAFDEITERTGLTEIEVMRKALSVLLFITGVTDAGDSVVIKDKDGTEEVIDFGLNKS